MSDEFAPGYWRRRVGGSPAWLLFLGGGLLVPSVVSWRQGDLYAGGVDPVVAAKALLNVFALLLALIAVRLTPRRNVMSSITLWLFAIMLAGSFFGAWYTRTTLSASLVDIARDAVIALTVQQFLRAYSTEQVLQVLVSWMAVVALIAAATGDAKAGAARGHLTHRLGGGIPQLQPNELAGLCAVVVVALVWRLLTGNGRWWDLPMLAVQLVIIWQTNSRTALLAAVLGIVFMVFQLRRVPVPAALSVLAAVGALFYVIAGTSAVSKYFERGGSSNISTLSSRTVAWSSAFHLHTVFWNIWFGSGLSQLQVPVSVKYRVVQVLDSSWVSALVQTGYVGLAVLGILAIRAFVVSFGRPAPFRILATGMTMFVVVRSILETGLISASPMYLVFLVLCFGARPPRPEPADPVAPAGELPASRVPAAAI